MITATETAPPASPPPALKFYSVGTLRYTAAGLAVLFSWLLWGDFCFTIFESIFGKFLPLYMADLHASNTLIGVMSGSVAGVLNILLLPGISMWSDRYRGPRGRRIPFLLWSTPCAVGALVLIGYAPEIGAALHRHLPALGRGISVPALTLGALCLFVVLYHSFNMVLVNIYQCLLRDVVPQVVMARFLSLFRVVGTAGSFIFSWYLFPHLLDYRKAMCTGVGAIYLASFVLMCWRVKEGNYPPPPPTDPSAGRFHVAKTFATYFRECLTVPLYRDYLILYAMITAASTCAGPFIVLFARDSLALSMDDIGKIFAWSAPVSAVLYVPMGYLCDRFSPIRVVFASLFSFVAAAAFALLLVHDKHGWLLYQVAVFMLPSVARNLGQNALTMHLFPAEKFGQLSSSLSVLGYGSIVIGNYLAGRYMDHVASDYRMIFAWSLFWYAAAIVPMAMVHRGWKRHGGPRHYVPPLPA